MSHAQDQSVGVVQTQTLRLSEPLRLACGKTLADVDVAYETYGELNATASNAVLVCHALSGDAHVAGYHPGEDPADPKTKPGWWDRMIGPGKPIDTDRYFVISSNVLGGCKGTTGPGSTDPGDRQGVRPVVPAGHDRGHGRGAAAAAGGAGRREAALRAGRIDGGDAVAGVVRAVSGSRGGRDADRDHGVAGGAVAGV